jgi:hypothetical protein
MKVSFKDFSATVPEKDSYERGVDYLCHEFDLKFEDALYLLKHLRNNRSSLLFYAPSAVVDFYIYGGELNVQIDGDRFWHASNLELEAAEEILKATFEGREDFGEQMPGTNREWDVY